MSMIFAQCNQKGGCGKSSMTLNLGAALARMGVKVLAVDSDPQANLTMALGYPQPDELPVTLPMVFQDIIDNQMRPGVPTLTLRREYILRAHGMDFVPSSIELAALETALINTISRETVMKRFLSHIRDDYDVILIDCMPSLNVITLNALTAADKVLVPLQPQFFSAKGLEMLLATIGGVRQQLNPKLTIGGALITMYDGRLKFHREVIDIVESAFGKYFKIFNTKIPVSVRVTETQARGRSIFEYDPSGKIAEAYGRFAEELMSGGVVNA
ncbi:MAG: ParA family protein [Clostridiales bacterium]|jgi:chromosome partitioning protein|nr:ParA family protein [Clostridiales bacterium]